MAQNINKSKRRQEKRQKDKNGMVITGRSVFIIQNTLIKKGKKKTQR
jgi:hypothetical protein